MLGPNTFAFWIHPSHLKYCFFFLSFFLLLSLLISHLQFLISFTLSIAWKLGLHQSKYKQSPCGFDTRTSVLLYCLWQTGTLVNELTICMEIDLIKQVWGEFGWKDTCIMLSMKVCTGFAFFYPWLPLVISLWFHGILEE